MDFGKVKIESANQFYALSLFRLQALPYKLYLQTEHWQHFKSEALRFYQFKCQLCNKSDTELNVHHRNYDNLGRETFNDVIVLCKDCHKIHHGRD